MSEPLHLVALHLDARALAREIPRAGLSNRQIDADYLVHAALRGLFPERRAFPFHHEAKGPREVRVLAYLPADAETLRHEADTFADPEWHGAVDWERFATKPMPTAFSPATRLGFAVRLVPVSRVARGHTEFPAGSEHDAFLLACGAAGPENPVSRDAVYHEWTRRLLERAGATLEAFHIDAFDLRTMTRRRPKDGRRVPNRFARPTIETTGTLRIDDPDRFAHRLRRGIGRHKAFGFGMIRLRPAS